MGSDPTTQIEALAKRVRLQCKAISMGQGQEVHARALLSHFMQDGGWVLLQNCHLGLEFMVELIDIILEAENPHPTFRLWMTTEVHPKFPIALLQICIKFTNDPPQGVRAGLKRTYTSLPPDTLEYTNAHQWRPMLYAISFMHSVVQERRKFGALGTCSVLSTCFCLHVDYSSNCDLPKQDGTFRMNSTGPIGEYEIG
jgi:dynein heavy chain